MCLPFVRGDLRPPGDRPRWLFLGGCGFGVIGVCIQLYIGFPVQGSSTVLYSRLCDLEALRVAVSESMKDLAETLIERGFLVPSPADDETSDEL